MAITFKPEWLQPVPTLTNDQLGMFGKWLGCNMGAMPVADRDRAKRLRKAVVAELARRRAANPTSRMRRSLRRIGVQSGC
jgi:hypothetical protein